MWLRIKLKVFNILLAQLSVCPIRPAEDLLHSEAAHDMLRPLATTK